MDVSISLAISKQNYKYGTTPTTVTAVWTAIRHGSLDRLVA